MGPALNFESGTILTRWMSAGAAVAGRSHERQGLRCQDVVGEAELDGVSAVALADGAGSAAKAEVGATVAVSATIQLLLSTFGSLLKADPTELRSHVLDTVLASLAQEARGAPLGDFASTLAFVAVGQGQFIAGHVGDGVIACERNGVAQVLSSPRRGEPVNETTFTTSRSAKSQLSLWRGDVGEVTAFTLMSDGTAESLYLRHEQRLAQAVTSLWRWMDAQAPATVRAALQRTLEGQLRESTGDDCSLAMLRRVQVSAADMDHRDSSFAQAFLRCRSRRSVKSRLAVLAALAAGEANGIAGICTRTGLAETTARAHVRALRDLRSPESANSNR